MTATKPQRGINRRTLLIGGGASVGLVLAWGLWPRRYRPNLHAAEDETVLNAFLKIGRDGRVIVAVPQAELGQGVWTSLPQILADELGADWRTVAVEPAPIHPLYANRLLAEEESGVLDGVTRWARQAYAEPSALMITGGSTSIRAFESPLREAGAAARALLSKAAAKRWDVEWDTLDTHSGFVWNGSQSIPFADLAAAAVEEQVPQDLPIRGGAQNRLTGEPLGRLDAPAKLDGSAMFAGDVRLPDMVYAAVRTGPPGARLTRFDRAAALRVPGAVAVVDRPDWIGAAAANWWAASRALDAAAPVFAGAPDLPGTRSMADALGRALQGDAVRVFAAGEPDTPVPASSPLEARYLVGPAPSAPLEPLTATARLTGDRLEVWAPTQAPALARAAAASAIGFDPSAVTIYPTLVGSGYGRKIEMDAIAQAAALAQTLERPVQLTWSRTQETQADRPRPSAVAILRARIVRGTEIAGWEARIAAPDTARDVAARIGAGNGLASAEAAPAAGAVPLYAIPNVAVDHLRADIGFATGLSRGGAHSYTHFFTESFIDEIARTVGAEPLSFRIRMLANNPRAARVLSSAASIGGWDGGARGSGMGLAVASAYGSYIAALVEVEITPAQTIRATRAVCAVDCGRLVNPAIVRQQIEGGFIHGLSAALGLPLPIRNGRPAARGFGELGLPRLADAPEMSVELVDSEEEPGGVTELGVTVAAPAIANAVHSLTGQRLRTLPLRLGSR